MYMYIYLYIYIGAQLGSMCMLCMRYPCRVCICMNSITVYICRVCICMLRVARTRRICVVRASIRQHMRVHTHAC